MRLPEDYEDAMERARDTRGIKRLCDELVESTTWFDGKPHLTPDQEEALQWAKEFMERYEQKHRKHEITPNP